MYNEMYKKDVQEMYRKMYKRCTRNVQEMYKKYRKYKRSTTDDIVQEIHKICTGNTQEMYRKYARGVQEMYKNVYISFNKTRFTNFDL